MSDFMDKIYKAIGESDFNQDVSGWLSTGYYPLNWALSGKFEYGGFPMGRITEIIGPESSGKTLLATMGLIETQRRDGLAIFLDFEHAFSVKRAIQLGLSTDRNNWIYKQPSTAEEGFKTIHFICEMVTKEKLETPVTVAVDSVASMVTKEEFDVEIGKDNMRTKLSLSVCMSMNLKKIAQAISRTNVTLIFLNQVRTNPGIAFGDSETTPGGKALKFYASTRLKLHKAGKVKDEETKDVIGENVRAQVIKNKVSEPFREAEYVGSFSEGINLYLSHINALNDRNMLGETKGWRVFNEKKYRERELEEFLRSDCDEYHRLLTLFDGLKR